MKYTIGLDLGTSSVKGVLLSESNDIIAERNLSVNYRVNFGYIGFDADQYCTEIFEMISKLVQKLPAEGVITAISSACASGNTVFCDIENKPLCDAVSWTNESMAKEAEAIFSLDMIESEKVRRLSGWPFLGTFSLAHLAYIKQKRPDIFRNTAKFAMSGEYLNYCLCGKWGIDRSSATPFYLLDQISGEWHKPYLDALGINNNMLPKVMRTGDVLGTLTEKAAKMCGLTTGTKLVLGAFDHPCAAFASGIVDEGQMLLSCGTSWVCLFPLHNRELIMEQKLLCDIFKAPGGCYAGMFSLPNVGSALKDIMRRCVGETENMHEKFYALAGEAKPGAGGLKIDITADEIPSLAGYLKSQIARAALEGIARALLKSIIRLKESGIHIQTAVMAGGPSQNKICRDIISGILKIPVEHKFGVNSGAVGAALIARGQF